MREVESGGSCLAPGAAERVRRLADDPGGMRSSMTRRFACILVVCCLLAVVARDAVAGITGNDFQTLPEAARMYYVLGTVDSWGNVSVESLAVKAPAVDAIYGNISRCVIGRKMTQGQVLAIVDKYMRDNPDKWHKDMTNLVWYALREACK